MAKPSEFDLIAKYFAPLSEGQGHQTGDAFGLLDDAAILAGLAHEDWVVTKDAIAEGSHFLPSDPPKTVAKKLLRVNLSDLAAKGAQPRHYVLAIALPATLSEEWIADFASGLFEDQKLFGLNLLGGDTIATKGPAVFSLTAFGSVPKGKMIRRAGAREGDHLFVTGPIGDAYLGLQLLTNKIAVSADSDVQSLIDAYRLPSPRVDLIEDLQRCASAALDVSDGLLADLNHLCTASGVGAQIELGAVPISQSAQRLLSEANLDTSSLFSGGDDYQILFSAPPDAAQVFGATKIGQVIETTGLWEKTQSGSLRAIESAGFRHF